MPIEIIVPRLSWSMNEGTFTAWLKHDGEAIHPGEPLFVLEGDKATQEIESMDAGILRLPPDAPAPGSTVKVGQRLAYLLASDEPAPWETSSAVTPLPSPLRDGSPSVVTNLRQERASSSPSPSSSPSLEDPQAPAQTRESRPPAISPRAARTARELGVDWTRVTGSGRTGRIRERDIRAAATGVNRMVAPSGLQASVIPAKSDSPAIPGTLSTTRRTIADRMMASLRSTAPVTLTATEDVTLLIQLRERWKVAAARDAMVVPSFTDILVKLSGAALSRHPAMATVWEGERLIRAQAIHIGIAVDTEAGLLVPVIRNVVELGLRDIATRSRDLAERARARTLAAEDLRGGVFTVTTLGAFGIDAFTPIINYPESGILGVGKVRRQPVAVDDQIVLQDRITFSLTFDHRAMDGATAARFLQTLCELVRSPGPHLKLEAPEGV